MEPDSSGSLLETALLGGPVARHVARAGDQVPEAVERHVGDRLHDLLVGPARLARLLVQVERGRALALEQALDEPEQRGLALVPRVELTGESDLVEPEPGVTSRALQRRECVLAALVLSHCEPDPLLGLQRQRPVPELRPKACVRTKRRGRAREYSD